MKNSKVPFILLLILGLTTKAPPQIPNITYQFSAVQHIQQRTSASVIGPLEFYLLGYPLTSIKYTYTGYQ
jgi:hypothetical protein